ncbi:MAG TPA: hypothetical protein VG758_34105 [Hyphomicrobiaceae bacterium]|jgi:hypothetical protein|nr:hypothetical protein [Hyphomicrobiaceae bacterium]
MRIVAREQFHGWWTAIDEATYDGPGSPIGSGRTPEEAEADLQWQLDDRDAELAEAVCQDARNHANPWS